MDLISESIGYLCVLWFLGGLAVAGLRASMEREVSLLSYYDYYVSESCEGMTVAAMPTSMYILSILQELENGIHSLVKII